MSALFYFSLYAKPEILILNELQSWLFQNEFATISEGSLVFLCTFDLFLFYNLELVPNHFKLQIQSVFFTNSKHPKTQIMIKKCWFTFLANCSTFVQWIIRVFHDVFFSVVYVFLGSAAFWESFRFHFVVLKLFHVLAINNQLSSVLSQLSE